MVESGSPQAEPAPAIDALIAESSWPALAELRWLLYQDDRFRVLGEVRTGDELTGFQPDPQLLVVDLALRGLNAHDAVKQFRATHAGCTIVVVAPVDAQYLRHAMAAAGADHYLVITRPTVQVLDRLVALQRRTSQQKSRSPL